MDQIKNLQRQDSQAKQAWWEYCDNDLGGVKDPNRHDERVLKRFLADFNSGRLTGDAREQLPAGFREPAAFRERPRARAAPLPMRPPARAREQAAPPSHPPPSRSSMRHAPQASASRSSYQQAPDRYQNSPVAERLRREELNRQALLEKQASYTPPATYYVQLPAGTGSGWAHGSGAPAQAQAPPSFGAATSGGSTLVEFIKTGQRQSGNWKTAWYSFCAVEGTGLSDPAKYDDAFLIRFIDYCGRIASQELAARAEDEGIDVNAAAGPKRAAPSSGRARPPPAKRPTFNGAYDDREDDYDRQEHREEVREEEHREERFEEDDDKPDKAGLVNKIKDLQRRDPEAKQAWWTYCTESLGGIKDPNRHDADILQGFLDQYS